MDLYLYERKTIENRSWFLAKCNLALYMENLRKDFFDFEIQRRIVKNVYLDGILHTIELGDPMPVITLTVDGEVKTRDDRHINISKFDILDGLQRTYRLWVVWRLIEIVNSSNCKNYKELLTQLKSDEEGKMLLDLDFVSVKLLKRLFEKDNDEVIYKDKLHSLYAQYDIYFAIWDGLSDDDIIKKMLILNAGQRSVSSVHQFELLFLHFFDDNKLTLYRNIHLYREKQKEYFRIKRGHRNAGEYALASIIIALQSYVEGKPLRVDPSNKVKFEDDTPVEGDELTRYFNADFLNCFIQRVYNIDLLLKVKGASYEMWYGKDTTLSGVFAALGAFLRENTLNFAKLDDAIQVITDIHDPFLLGEFDEAYSNLSSVRVNVGKVLRDAVFEYTKGLLTGNRIDWYQAFNMEK